MVLRLEGILRITRIEIGQIGILVNQIVPSNGSMCDEWIKSTIVHFYKNKGDIQN